MKTMKSTRKKVTMALLSRPQPAANAPPLCAVPGSYGKDPVAAATYTHDY